MSDTPPLTDRPALLRNRNRATELFLHEAARDEAKDRASMVNKTFTDPVVVSPFPSLWPDRQTIADEDVLALDQSAHDLVMHMMALHWANDPVGQLIQCRRAMRPDGLFIAICLGGQTLHELRACLAEAESEVTGGLSPRVAPMAEIRDLGALLQRAGFALPVADSDLLTVSYSSPFHLMRDLRAMGEGNALDARLRHPTRRTVLLRAAALYTERFATSDGRITATFERITLTGWAPDASQPQPLRPGSAAQSLAQALGTTETPLKD